MGLRSSLRRRGKRTWIVTGGVVVAVAAGSIYWFGFGPMAASAQTTPTATTVTASLQTMQKTVSATGPLTPKSTEDVSFIASGTVTAVKVSAGTTVKAGATLATLTTLTEKANLLTAKATLASARAQLSSAESSSTGSTSDVASIAADEAAVAVAAAAVTTAQTEYDGTTLVAPIAGLVTAVNVAVGDVVSSGSASSSSSAAGATGSSTSSTGSASTTTTSTADFTIIGTSSWNVSVSLSASDIKNIKVGQQVDLSTDENASFFGTVASIGLLPSTTTGAATYPVVVTVTGSPKDLYDGVTVTAKIIYEKRTNVLTVPSAAVTTSNGKSTVKKVTNGKTVTTTVTVGETVGSLTEITKGLATGDVVSVTRFTPGTGNTGTTTGRTGTGTGTGTNNGPPSGTFPGGTMGGSTNG